MKLKRLAPATILIATPVIMAAYYLFSPDAPRPSLNAEKLREAAVAFTDDLKAKGAPLPATVSLRQLIAGGYIQTNDVRAFDGIELTLNLALNSTNRESHPNTILAQAKLPDGDFVVLRGDGSVQQVTPAVLEAQIRASEEEPSRARSVNPSSVPEGKP